MYLKCIKMYGFKSFADKMEINFGKNINGIVGPNGSGKSNVVDAVRWVLGEQSNKSLRAENSSDVIFSGSKSRKALNSASVTLVFDNSDLYLPISYTEVSIKRVMYRNGENEYFLNNERCRLKDITSLLTDSGADRESFNIIGQGKIDEILSTKPCDRRAVFESAAGVLKYKRRKEEAIRKLERTNSNIDRVNDIILELDNQLVPLEKQSKDANKFLHLKDTLGELEISLMVRDIQNLNYSTEDFKERIDLLNDEIVELSRNCSNYDVDLLSKKDEIKKVEKDISEHQSTLIELTKNIEKIDADIRVLRTRKEMDVSSSESQFLKMREDVLKKETFINELNNELDSINQKFSNVSSKYENEEDKYRELVKERNKLNDLREKYYREQSDLKYKIDIIESRLENGDYLPSAVKSIINNTRFHGVHDVLGNLIDMDDEYRVAISTSLGGALNYLVVDSSHDAKEMVEYLKDKELGRATFFPIDVIKARVIDSDSLDKLKNISGFVSVASDVVKRENILDNIVKNQLGNVVIADNLDNANVISKAILNRYKVVTLDGQVVNVGGSITGGSRSNQRDCLRDKFQLTSCKQELFLLEEKIRDLEDKISLKKEEVLDKERVVYGINQELLVILDEKKNKSRVLEATKEEKSSLEKEILGIESLYHNEGEKRLDDMLNLYYSAISNKDNVEKEKDMLLYKKDSLESDILEIEDLVKRDQHYLSMKEKELKSLEIRLNSDNIKLDNLLISLGDDYGITYDKARDNYHLDIEEDVARDKVKSLKEEIKGLGYVNVDSIEEYDRVKNRYDFLMGQRNDLKVAEDTLNNIIDEMDNIMKERFRITFEAIRVEFKKVFKEMFGGGEAELILTDPDNLLETGIEIEAVPTGKVLKSISLLSGGEKTFTAISLLFAILNVRPVPFCLLDEVEAALDEANVESFGNYLNQYRDKTQFILITHKKKTMEFTDILYGITMQESGVSKLVSVRLEDLKEV